MKYGRYGLPYLFLRVGLGLVFLWIGIDILRHPESWIGFVPLEVPAGFTRENVLRFNGLLDSVLGLALLLNIWPRIVGTLAVIHLAGILVTNGIDAVLIRDVGLLGAALAIVAWPQHRHRWQGWKFWRRKPSGLES